MKYLDIYPDASHILDKSADFIKNLEELNKIL